MNRRKFFGGLIQGILTASVAPQVILNATTKWKQTGLIWHGDIRDTDLYQRLPYYLVKMELNLERLEVDKSWQEFLSLQPWPANMGETIRPIMLDRKDTV